MVNPYNNNFGRDMENGGGDLNYFDNLSNLNAYEDAANPINQKQTSNPTKNRRRSVVPGTEYTWLDSLGDSLKNKASRYFEEGSKIVGDEARAAWDNGKKEFSKVVNPATFGFDSPVSFGDKGGMGLFEAGKTLKGRQLEEYLKDYTARRGKGDIVAGNRQKLQDLENDKKVSDHKFKVEAARDKENRENESYRKEKPIASSLGDIYESGVGSFNDFIDSDVAGEIGDFASEHTGGLGAAAGLGAAGLAANRMFKRKPKVPMGLGGKLSKFLRKF